MIARAAKALKLDVAVNDGDVIDETIVSFAERLNARLDDIEARLSKKPEWKPLEVSLSDMPDGFWDDAELVPPLTKTAISLRVDADVLEFFKAQGDGHLTRMNAVLRTYMERTKAQTSD